MSINSLDVENQLRLEILEGMNIATLWDIMMEEDFEEEKIKEILVDFIYDHNISSDQLKEYQ